MFKQYFSLLFIGLLLNPAFSQLNPDGAPCHQCWSISNEYHCVYTQTNTLCTLFFDYTAGEWTCVQYANQSFPCNN